MKTEILETKEWKTNDGEKGETTVERRLDKRYRVNSKVLIRQTVVKRDIFFGKTMVFLPFPILTRFFEELLLEDIAVKDPKLPLVIERIEQAIAQWKKGGDKNGVRK